MTVIQPAFNASNSIIVRLKIDLAVPPSSRLAFLCQTISGEGDIVGAIDLVEPQDGLLTRDIRQLTRLPARLMNLIFVQIILSIARLIRPFYTNNFQNCSGGCFQNWSNTDAEKANGRTLYS